MLNAVRHAYFGKPGHSLARRIGQGVVTVTLTLAALGAVLPEPEQQPHRVSSAPAFVAPVVTHTAEPVETAAPVAPVPTVRATTAAPKPTTAAPKPVVRATTTAPKPVVRVTTAPPKPAPKPKATVLSTCGAPGNPWGYNFCGRGSTISSPPSSFCNWFDCIPSFWESTNGYVMQCDDGMYSHSGGRSGSCSHHGGNNRALYG